MRNQMVRLSLNNIIILEQASIELLPKSLRKHKSSRDVFTRFGVLPERQIMDDNFHHEAIAKLEDREKRGRPDVVHFALLEIISAPLYLENKVSVAIHTWGNDTIWLKQGVRLPRTLIRFSGLISKILAEEIGRDESKFFELSKGQSIQELLDEIGSSHVYSFTKIGRPTDLRGFVSDNREKLGNEKSVWIVGGFPFGHFVESVIESSDQVLSISSYSLPAHVVTSRLTYELERLLCSCETRA